MAKAKGKRESHKAQYSAYKGLNKYEENRIARLKRTIKAQPGNEALKKVLAKWEKEGVPYRRNRKAVLLGINKVKTPQTSFNLQKHRAWEKKQPRTKSDIWLALKPLHDAARRKPNAKRVSA